MLNLESTPGLDRHHGWHPRNASATDMRRPPRDQSRMLWYHTNSFCRAQIALYQPSVSIANDISESHHFTLSSLALTSQPDSSSMTLNQQRLHRIRRCATP